MILCAAVHFDDCLAQPLAMEKKKRLTAYDAAFELQVVAYAEQNGKRAAGWNFHVDDKCVRRWRDQKEELAAINKTRKAFRNKPCKF